MNRAQKSLIELSSDITFAAKSGYEINFLDDSWILDKNRSLGFTFIRNRLNDNAMLFSEYKLVMKFYSQNYSSAHCVNMQSCFILFLKLTDSSVFSTTSLINFRNSLGAEREYVLGGLSGFLKKWNELGYEGVSDEVVELLDSWRLKGNVKGDVVKRLDPEQGPLSDIELQSINEAAATLYEIDRISLDVFAMVRLLSATGRRPIQLSHMKLKDVMHGSNNNQGLAYVLNIPRAKQRGAIFRESFKQMQVTEDLWRILDLQRSSVINFFESKFSKLSNEILLELPLFPDYKLVNGCHNVKTLSDSLSLDTLHCRRAEFTEAAKKVIQYGDVISERTGQLININAQRFRYSVGTRAAREGYGTLVIAELLDHEDTQNAQVYVENVPEYARRINDKVGNLMVPYANAFKGVIVVDESQARRGSDPNSRIRLNPSENAGTCGNYDSCGSKVPVPCYTCLHFQPWLDAPHQKVLDGLLEERERVYEQTNDLAIASINDRTIVAVVEVLELCNAKRKEMDNG